MSYDNKYKQESSFATDQGRFKTELNVNRADAGVLKSASKASLMDDLRQSNIRFDFDERGPEQFRKMDQDVDM